MNDTPNNGTRERVEITSPEATDVLFSLFGRDSDAEANIHTIVKAQKVSDMVISRFQPLAAAVLGSALLRNQLIAFLERTPPSADDKTAAAVYQMDGVLLFYRTFIEGFYLPIPADKIKTWATPERIALLNTLFGILKLEPGTVNAGDDAFNALTPNSVALLGLTLGDVVVAEENNPIAQFLAQVLSRGGAPAEGSGGGLDDEPSDGDTLNSAFEADGNRRQPVDPEDLN